MRKSAQLRKKSHRGGEKETYGRWETERMGVHATRVKVLQLQKLLNKWGKAEAVGPSGIVGPAWRNYETGLKTHDLNKKVAQITRSRNGRQT